MPHALSLDIDSREHSRWVKRTFPSLSDLIYLQSAGRGPMPCDVVKSMRSLVEGSCGTIMDRPWEDATLREFRPQAAGLIGSRKEEIAFVTSTTAGIDLFANSIRWKRGDEILLADIEYPANVTPWVKIAMDRGVRINRLSTRDGLIRPEDIERKISDKTKVFPLSLVQFSTGQRFDVKHVAEICDDHGTLLFLDAIQALGAVRVNVRKANIAGLSAGGYKWLCGPIGSGILYISDSARSELNPASVSWRSINGEQRRSLWERVVVGGNLIDDEIMPAKDASAFEILTDCYLQMHGLTESIRFLRSIGIDKIEERIHRLNDHLMEGLDDHGFEIITPREREKRAGIVSFNPNRKISRVKEANEIVKDLGKVTMAIRGGSFRIATHFFNSKREIDEALAAVVKACRKRGFIRR